MKKGFIKSTSSVTLRHINSWFICTFIKDNTNVYDIDSLKCVLTVTANLISKNFRKLYICYVDLTFNTGFHRILLL